MRASLESHDQDLTLKASPGMPREPPKEGTVTCEMVLFHFLSSQNDGVTVAASLSVPLRTRADYAAARRLLERPPSG